MVCLGCRDFQKNKKQKKNNLIYYELYCEKKSDDRQF